MQKTTKFSARWRWAVAIGLAALHPILLYYLVPFFGERANLVVFFAPVAATLLLGLRVGLSFVPANVLTTSIMFGGVLNVEPSIGLRPKGIVAAAIVALLCYAADQIRKSVRQRQLLKEALVRARKLEAIGQLAGGVAHDMNNTLNAIMGSVFAHRQELSVYGKSFKDLDNIAAACDRGAQLTQNLLGFARKESVKTQVFSLNRVVMGSEFLLRRTASKQIRIVSALASPEPFMEGDLGQIENALMNLCLNALDAIGRSGTLTLTTGFDGKMVFLRVSDTGEGMERSVQEQVFEPFFTTKEAGMGTGLGLSIVYGAVRAMKGKIKLESAPGLGTDITLSFPAQQPVDKAHQSAGRLTPTPTPAGRASILADRTVLLVDDEPLVLRAGVRMLKTLGSDVLSASSGEEAVSLFEKRRHDISMVVLDLIMPGLDGIGTMDRLHQIDPEIPVVLVSGYTKNMFKGEDMITEREFVRFLAKPYKADQLSSIARSLLGNVDQDRDSQSNLA